MKFQVRCEIRRDSWSKEGLLTGMRGIWGQTTDRGKYRGKMGLGNFKKFWTLSNTM